MQVGVLVRLILALFLAISPGAAPAAADDANQAAIRRALMHWTEDFNARNADKVCDLFEPGLIYDFQGLPEQHYDDICPRLKRALGDETRSWTYAQPDIKEILVFGDMAVVRPHLDVDSHGRPRGRRQIRRARHGHLPPSARRKLEDHALPGV